MKNPATVEALSREWLAKYGLKQLILSLIHTELVQ